MIVQEFGPNQPGNFSPSRANNWPDVGSRISRNVDSGGVSALRVLAENSPNPWLAGQLNVLASWYDGSLLTPDNTPKIFGLKQLLNSPDNFTDRLLKLIVEDKSQVVAELLEFWPHHTLKVQGLNWTKEQLNTLTSELLSGSDQEVLLLTRLLGMNAALTIEVSKALERVCNRRPMTAELWIELANTYLNERSTLGVQEFLKQHERLESVVRRGEKLAGLFQTLTLPVEITSQILRIVSPKLGWAQDKLNDLGEMIRDSSGIPRSCRVEFRYTTLSSLARNGIGSSYPEVESWLKKIGNRTLSNGESWLVDIAAGLSKDVFRQSPRAFRKLQDAVDQVIVSEDRLHPLGHRYFEFKSQLASLCLSVDNGHQAVLYNFEQIANSDLFGVSPRLLAVGILLGSSNENARAIILKPTDERRNIIPLIRELQLEELIGNMDLSASRTIQVRSRSDKPREVISFLQECRSPGAAFLLAKLFGGTNRADVINAISSCMSPAEIPENDASEKQRRLLLKMYINEVVTGDERELYRIQA
jgi:hypothetical protein